MNKTIAWVVLMPILITACGPQSAPQPKVDVKRTNDANLPSVEAASRTPVGYCATKFAGVANGNGKLIFPASQQLLPWGSSEIQVQDVARSISKETSRDVRGLMVKVNGFDDWIQFEFTFGKLSRVRERHNNDSRQPPFVDAYLSEIKTLLGNNATTSIDGNGACSAVWQSATGYTKAVWRDNEWFIDIYYEPKDGLPTLPATKEAEVWSFYSQMEDKVGKESALTATAEHFKLTQDDVFQVIVRGLEKGRPLPEAAPLSKTAAPRYPAQNAPRREALPSEDRRSFDALKARGHSDSDARNAASALRRLCEASKGTDCQ
jgi:hypothetical protein